MCLWIQNFNMEPWPVVYPGFESLPFPKVADKSWIRCILVFYGGSGFRKPGLGLVQVSQTRIWCLHAHETTGILLG